MNTRGRGRGGSSNRGRGNKPIILAQHGSNKLIAANITNTPQAINDPLYKEFLEFKAKNSQSNTQTTSESPSYAHIAGEEENEEYFQNDLKEVILPLEDRDLRWKTDPWYLLQKYFDTGASFSAGSYKPRSYYENILKATNSWEITHFSNSGRGKNVYSFSKAIIKQVISAEEWGLSTFREREYFQPELKSSVKFNYWDYTEAFHKALLYQNPMRKHTWFIKVCPEVYKKDLPNWLYQWWQNFGPKINILPEILNGLYSEWVDISPKLIEAQHENRWIEGMPISHFFIEFGIPWILKWEPEFGYTKQNIPCIYRVCSSKFWKKMLRNNEQGVMEGQDTIEKIKMAVAQYKQQIELEQQRKSPSPFQFISKKLQTQKGQLTNEEIIASYMEAMKKDLFENFGVEIQPPEISMTGSSHGEAKNMEDSQDPYEEEEDIPLEEMLAELEQDKRRKGKAPAP